MRNFYYFIILLIALVFIFGIDFDYARELTINNEPNDVTVKSSLPQFSMAHKIQEGIESLKISAPLGYENKAVKQRNGRLTVTNELSRKQIALAILDYKTGEIFEHRVWTSENEIKNYKKTGILNLEPVDSNSSLVVEVEWWNSFNSVYRVGPSDLRASDSKRLAVIANKFLFPSAYLSGLPERSTQQYADIIYAPYSKPLHLPELIEAGNDYLEKNINQALAELDTDKVRSLAVSGTLVTSGITKDFIKNIVLVEHIDPDAFSVATDGGQELAERVLVVIGANQNSAYRYTGSPAGASGLAQFIKPTYDLMAAKYPKARLIKNYNAGMVNHVNAIKAMVLFFDSHRKEISDKVTDRGIVRSLGITEEMLAAAYNGGPSRVVKSVNNFGRGWLSKQVNSSNAVRIFRPETISYIKKFQAIKNLNLFANISGSLEN